MGRAKDIRVLPISAKDANAIVKRIHYSGKTVKNSQLHLGVFMDGKCGGAMQFGSSIDKRKMQGLVSGTPWNGFIELNRMAFADWLPRNSESRALGYAFRFIQARYPHIEWIVSFADGTQCGDGAIYRASGFTLTGIKKNTQMLKMPNGDIIAKKTLDNPNNMGADGRFGSWHARAGGAVPLPGFQLRYIYFMNAEARARLTVPILPFSEIEKRGAGMYKGKPSAGSKDSVASSFQDEEGGAIPTPALQRLP
jgi:hypothetical protein